MGIGHNTISAGIYDALHLQPSLSTLDAHLQVSWWLRRRRSEDPRNLEEFGTLGPFPYQNFVFLCVFDSFFIYLGQVQYQLTPGNVMSLQQSPMAGFKLIIISSNIQTKFHRTNSAPQKFARAQILSYGALGSLASLHARSHHLGERSGSRIPLPSCKFCKLRVMGGGYLFFFWGSRYSSL